MKGKPKLHILCDYQLNIYLTVDSVVKLSQKINKITLISVRDIPEAAIEGVQASVDALKLLFGDWCLK